MPGGGGPGASLPGDLVILGDWGWAAGSVSDDVLLGVKALAGFFTLRADAVLANARQTPEGAFLSYANLPLEAQEVIRAWRLGEQAVAT